MYGYLSTEKKAAPWNSADTTSYLTAAAVGVLAGIVVTYARTPLHLPGHKVLFWMTPILATRLLNRSQAGASTGAFATVITTLLLGGRLAGGVAMMPLVVIAGIILDVATTLVERHNLSPSRALLLLALAGAAGNLVCFIKRIFEPIGTFFSTANLSDLLTAAASHAFFGFLAGLLGAAMGFGLLTLRSRTLSAKKQRAAD